MQSYVYVIWLNHVVSTSAIQQTTTEILYPNKLQKYSSRLTTEKKMITKQVDGQTKKWLFNNLWFGRFERSLNQNDTIGGFRQMCRNLKVSRTTRLITKNAIEGFDLGMFNFSDLLSSNFEIDILIKILYMFISVCSIYQKAWRIVC